LSYTPSNEKPKKQLYDKLKSMLGQLGMHGGHLLPHDAYLKNEIPVAGVAHHLHLEKLARACEKRRSREFLFVGAALRILGGTGSPLNPIAIL
jgi:hypothetical protein